MLFKLILCIIVILSGIGIGQLKAKAFDNRLIHLQDCITTFKILESEMKFRLDPLPVLFLRIKDMKDGMAGSLLERTCMLLGDFNHSDFSSCWTEAVEMTYKDSSLTREDKQIICDLGIDLGKTDIGSQFSLFSRTFTLLENQVTEALELKQTKGKMYKSLGAAAGILTVILLI